ncbi:MAG: hypothetical protein R3338_09745 [Thermoanaerobaculia bacterium]|nr:hypothetical protein [Thermoanaerobaculia bacterium]
MHFLLTISLVAVLTVSLGFTVSWLAARLVLAVAAARVAPRSAHRSDERPGT